MNWVSFPQTEEMRQVFDEAPSGIILGGQETIFNNPKRKEFQKTLQRIHNTMPGSILNKTTEGVK
jgi:type II secretory pathway predicted ATPase ExeA